MYAERKLQFLTPRHTPVGIKSADKIDRAPDGSFTVYDLEVRESLLLDRETQMSMVTAAHASSSAPSYFEPVQVGDATLVDGGVFAANPAMCAYAEALKRVPSNDLFMVSIGTGTPTGPLPYEELREWGLVHWARALRDLNVAGVNHVVDHQLEHLLRPHCYYRLQAHIGHKHMPLDDVGPTHLKTMRDAAAKLIAERDSDLDAICDRLLQPA